MTDAVDLEATSLDYDEIINFYGKDYLSSIADQIRLEKKEADADHDPVNRPLHYTQGGIECIDAMKASMSDEEFLGFLRGNSFKYLWRCHEKGKATEDLKKGRWYLDRLIQELDK